jgi:MFS family permease
VPFLASVVARMPISMAPLSIVLLVQQVRGSYAVAGVVTGALALGTALASPALGRLVDRLGQPRVIALSGTVSAALLAALAAATVGGASDAALVALAGASGLAMPPVGAAMRGAWRTALPDAADWQLAYALDAVATEFVFVVGPLLVALLLLAPAVVPLLATAALLAGGCLAYARADAVRAWRPEPHPHAEGTARSPITHAGVLAVVLAVLVVSAGFAHLDLAIAATAREALHDQSRVGLLFACIAGGSALGGLWYGSRHWPGAERVRLPVLLAATAAGLLAAAVLLGGVRGVVQAPPLVVLGALLLVTGLTIAPAIIIVGNLIDAQAPRSRLSEAQAWLSTAYTAGGAGGTAIAGWLVDAGGPGRGVLGAGLLMAGGALAAVAAQPVWRRAPAARADVPG